MPLRLHAPVPEALVKGPHALEKRGRWVAQFTAGYDSKTGRRIYRCKMAPTRREAARKLEELRRTYASLSGIKAESMTAEKTRMIKDIQTQLGHSTIRVTMDLYPHIGDSEKEQVKNWLQLGVNSLLTPAQPLHPANKIPHNFS